MRYLLTAVLAIMAADACQAAGDSAITMSGKQVAILLGEPGIIGTHFKRDGTVLNSTLAYWHVDALGGSTWLVFELDDNDRVTRFRCNYYPFENTPPWLSALRIALAPAGK